MGQRFSKLRKEVEKLFFYGFGIYQQFYPTKSVGCFNLLANKLPRIEQFGSLNLIDLFILIDLLNPFLNRPIIKFYNSDDVNVIAAELWLIKTKSSSFTKKQSFTRNNANRCKQRFEN